MALQRVTCGSAERRPEHEEELEEFCRPVWEHRPVESGFVWRGPGLWEPPQPSSSFLCKLENSRVPTGRFSRNEPEER